MADPTAEQNASDMIAVANGTETAFPNPLQQHQNGDFLCWPTPGLTKRELFAAMAMQGAMRELAIQAEDFGEDDVVDPRPIARDAVRMADALLKELAK